MNQFSSIWVPKSKIIMTNTIVDISVIAKTTNSFIEEKMIFIIYIIIPPKESKICKIMFNKNDVYLRKGRF